MLRRDRNLIGVIGFLLLILVLICFFIVLKQQDTLETLVNSARVTGEHEQTQENRIRNLHRQVKALEKEDERLLAHIKWFVMRRSGTNELRKMEAVVARLEAAE